MNRYTEEFKQDAINLIENKGYSAKQVSEKFGVSQQT